MKKLPRTPNGNVDKRTKEYKAYLHKREAAAVAHEEQFDRTAPHHYIPPTPPIPSVLEEAESLIHGDREQDYGHPSKNLRAIADMWEMYLHHKYKADFPIEASDVAWMMNLLKMCRDFQGAKRDTIVDAAGYIGLIGRVRYE